MTFRTLGAWATAGVALWVSLGVLDVVDGPSGAVRIAMLPGLAQLAGSLALSLLLGVIFDWRGAATRWNADPVLPLYGLAVLVLPYLPWLADGLPVLRVFAGPGRYLVWIIVLGQVLWAALGSGGGRRTAAAIHVMAPARTFLLTFAATALLMLGAALGLAPSGLFPAGDEPHYLVAAQSLAADRDLNVDNNYQQRSYAAYYSTPLERRATASGTTLMAPGLPVLLAPAFGWCGYPGALLLVIALSSLSAAVVWVWTRRLTESASAATFAWAATTVTVPTLVGGVSMTPDAPAGLLIAVAATFALWPSPIVHSAGSDGDAPMPLWQSVLAGLVAACLPWLHPVYLPTSIVIAGIAAGRAWRASRADAAARIGAVLVPATVGIAGWCAFSLNTTGASWISAQSLGSQTPFPSLALIGRHAFALLVDQEYGALSYAPAIAIAAIGLAGLWNQRGAARRRAVEATLLLASVVISAAIVRAWHPGSARPGEWALPALLVAAAPLAYEYRRAGRQPARRAMYRLLLLMGLGASLAMMTVRGGNLMALTGDGVSRLVEWLSPDWHLWIYTPDLMAQSAWLGLAQAAIWLGAVLIGTGFVSGVASHGQQPPNSRTGRGRAFLWADIGALMAVLIATGGMPLIIGSWLKPTPDTRDRRHIELLDTFDPRGRPIALRFDPFSTLDARTVPSQFELRARPVSTSDEQPEATAFNAKFALPTGRYRIQVIGRASLSDESPLTGRLRLQAGTSGGSMVEWGIEGTDSRQWSDVFDLPADVGMVSFATSGKLGSQVRELRIVPYRVVPFLDRIAAEDVRAAAAYDRLMFLFHDDRTYPDATGFWVQGGSRARVSVVSRTGLLISDLRLVLRSRTPNTIHIEMPDRVWTETLGQDEEREILIKPTLLDGTVRLVITPERGFYPIDTERGSTDRRHLGCYVRILE